MSDTLILHGGTNIREVQIDQTRTGDQVGNALYALTQDAVSHTERFLHGGALVSHSQQFIIRDRDQCINILLEQSDTCFSRAHFLCAFKTERLGNDANGQDPHILGHFGNDGSRAGTGAAAHTSGNEYHVRAGKHLTDLILVFLSRLHTYFRLSSGTQTLGQLLADEQLLFGLGQRQDLLICIDNDEVRALQTILDHTLYCIVAAAADAYDANDGCIGVFLIEIEF